MFLVEYPVVLAMVFLWIGFVSAISFMEAGLKFRAPGITLPLGLGIGKIIFRTMNKVEWILSVAILLNIMVYRPDHGLEINLYWFTIPFLILLIQTIWALPALNRRAQQIIAGDQLPPSHLHIYYVALEVVKISCLLVFGISLFSV